MKIAIVANCQARPIGNIIHSLMPSAQMLEPIIIHLAKSGDEEKDLSHLQQADLILAQYVQDNYSTPHVSTSNLKQHFRDKVISWPNIFFSGQTPSLCYITSDQTRLRSPLDIYHCIVIFDQWQAGSSTQQAIDLLNDVDFWAERINSIINQSMLALKEREQHVDITVSEIIQLNYKSLRLFHSFNHPSLWLLHEFVIKVLKYLELNPRNELDIKGRPEPLGQIQAPIYKALQKAMGANISGTEMIKGVKLKYTNGGITGKALPIEYTLMEFVNTCFEAYDSQRALILNTRFTPPFWKNL